MIEEGEGECSLAYFCLLRLHLLPSQVAGLPRREKAFLMAAVELYAEEQRRQEKRLKKR